MDPKPPDAAPRAIPPLRLAVEVPLDPAAAFRLFTTDMARWWPLGTHSVGEARAVACGFDERAGGRVFERWRDGTEETWGTILAWEPPDRVVFTWHPGQPPATAQEVEVRFQPTATGSRVELEHRGWERLGDRAAEARRGYEQGWGLVVGEIYRRAAGG